MPPDESDREHTGRNRVLAVQRNVADSKAAGGILQLHFVGATCAPALRSCPRRVRRAPASKPCVAGPPAAAAGLRRATSSAALRTPAAVSWVLTRCTLPCLFTRCCTISCAALAATKNTRQARSAANRGSQRAPVAGARPPRTFQERSRARPAPCPPPSPGRRLRPSFGAPVMRKSLHKTAISQALSQFVDFRKNKKIPVTLDRLRVEGAEGSACASIYVVK